MMADNIKYQFFQDYGFSDELKARMHKNTPDLIELINRGLIVNHRDFDKIMDCVENGKEIYIYTGRGPSSSSLHFGHYLPFFITQKLQQILGAKVVIQITDDEKYLYAKNEKTPNTLSYYTKLADDNIKDIIAFGFDPSKTFIFKNTEFMGNLYSVDLQIKRFFTINQIKHSFGITDSDNVGKLSYPSIQMVPCVPSVFDGFIGKDAQCLIPCADDQEVYFRLARDILNKMKVKKPSMVFVGYVPSIQTIEEKMSSSKPDTAIFLNDSNKQIRKQINKAFSGGRDTIEEHREKGAQCKVDVPLNILKYFIDTVEFNKIKELYGSGEYLSSQVKNIVIDKLIEIKDRFASTRNIPKYTTHEFTSLHKTSK